MRFKTAFAISIWTVHVFAAPPDRAAGTKPAFFRAVVRACGSLLSREPGPAKSRTGESGKSWYGVDHQPDLNHDFIRETLFVIPPNDGEAVRSLEILEGLAAPYVHVSRQGWGASIDREILPPEKLAAVSRVLIFEMPGHAGENAIARAGKEIVLVDHHGSQTHPDRYRNESSIEQLSTLIGYRMSAFDRAVGINDRGYISGLRAAGLDEAQIRAVRTFDLKAQGRTELGIRRAVEDAQSLIPFLAVHGDLTFYGGESVDSGILSQELALRSPEGIAKLFGFGHGVSYSGDSETVDRLAAINLESFGLDPADFNMYHGGDRAAGSMFFRLVPKPGSGQRVPEAVLDVAEKIAVERAIHKSVPPLRPVTELRFKTFGSLSSPAIVFVHDSRSTSEVFRGVAKLLARDFFVITYDTRGLGRSAGDGNDCSADVLASDLLHLLDYLGVEKVNLVGHGQGAKTVVRFAATHPGRTGKVVLEDAPLHAVERYTARTNDKYARTLLNIRLAGGPRERISSNSLIYRARARREDARRDLARVNLDDVLALQSVRFSKEFETSERQNQDAPKLRSIILDGSYAPHEEHPKRFVKELRDFIRDGGR